MMTEYEWILSAGRLCLSGYPIRIERGGPNRPFVLKQECREDTTFQTLAYAKLAGQQRAAELAEFGAAG